jgi:hypothetical protein
MAWSLIKHRTTSRVILTFILSLKYPVNLALKCVYICRRVQTTVKLTFCFIVIRVINSGKIRWAGHEGHRGREETRTWFWWKNEGKVKVKVTLEQATMAQRGSRV